MVKTRPQGPGYTLRVPCLDVASGEKIAITGPSGCGKSTALDLLGLVLRPDAAQCARFWPGEAAIDVMALWAGGRHDALAAVRMHHMGYVLQTGGLLPFLPVFENMALTVRARGLADVAARVGRLAERLGVSRLLNAMPGTLSVGERQRVAIGRALAAGPRVLFADEPTASLDSVHAATVLDLLLDAVNEAGMTLIMVTHDRSVVQRGNLRELCMTVRPEGDGVTAVLAEHGAAAAEDEPAPHNGVRHA